VIRTLNNGGDENVKGDGSGGYTYSGGDGGNGGNGGYTESAWAKKKRLEKEARDRADTNRPTGTVSGDRVWTESNTWVDKNSDEGNIALGTKEGTYYDGKIWSGTTWVDPKSKEAADVLGTKYGDKDDEDGTVWDGNTWVNQEDDEGKIVLGLPTKREEKITSETERLKKKREDKARPLGTTNEDGKVWTGYGKGWKDPDSNEAAIASGVELGNRKGDQVWAGVKNGGWVNKDSDEAAVASGVENGNIGSGGNSGKVWSGDKGTWVDQDSDDGAIASGVENGNIKGDQVWSGDQGTWVDLNSDAGNVASGTEVGTENESGEVWNGSTWEDPQPIIDGIVDDAEADAIVEEYENIEDRGDILAGDEDRGVHGAVGESGTTYYDTTGEEGKNYFKALDKYYSGDAWDDPDYTGEADTGDDDDTDTYDSSQDDPSGQPKDSVTLEEEAEDEASNINWASQPDDDDTDTFDSSGQDDPADITPDDDDTDTLDTSGYDPSLGNIYYGEDDDTDTFDSNEDAGGTTLYDPYTGDSEDDLGTLETDPTDDPDGSGGDDPIVIPDDNDDDDPTTGDHDTGGGPDIGGPTGETDQEKLLADLEEKYEEYGETDYEALFKGEFEDDLKQDYDASTRSAERAYLTSGDLSEFNTTGNTINDQLLALEESFEGEEKDYLDEMSANYATGPKKAIEEWYKRQRQAILRGEIDSIEELDLSEWSDPSDEYDPEFFKDVDYSKLYENMEGDTVAQDESGDYYDREDQDPHTDWFEDDEEEDATEDDADQTPSWWEEGGSGIDPNKGPEPLELDTDPNIPDPTEEGSLEGSEDLHGEVVDGTFVPETLDDEGDDQISGGDDLGFGDDGLDDVVGGDDDMMGIDPETGEPYAPTDTSSFNFGGVTDPFDLPDDIPDDFQDWGDYPEEEEGDAIEGVIEPEPEPEPEPVDTTPVTDGEAGLYGWIDDDRIPSQTEIDYYMNLGGGGEVTQDHVDEIQEGLGVNPGDPGYIYYGDTNLGTEMADPVFDVFEDEGGGSEGLDFDDSLGGFDFGDEFPPGYTDPEGITGPMPSSKSSAPSNDAFGGYYDTNTFDMGNPDAWMQAPTAKPKVKQISNKTKPLRPSQRPRRGGGGQYSSYGPR